MLLSGLAIFAAGCLGCCGCNATLMLALRFLQAISVCAAAVTWQAMVADYYPAQRTTASSPPLCRYGTVAGAGPLLGSWLLLRLSGTIFATLFAITCC